MFYYKLAGLPLKAPLVLRNLLPKNVFLLQQYRCFQLKSHYAVLGVKPEATDEEIKQAYYSLSKKYHPDLNLGNKVAESKILEINAAFEVLGNKEEKKKYDSKLFPKIWEKQSFVYDREEAPPDSQNFIFRRTFKVQPSSFDQYLRHHRGQEKRKYRHGVQKQMFNRDQSSQKMCKIFKS